MNHTTKASRLRQNRQQQQPQRQYNKFVEGVMKRLDFPATAPKAEVEKKLSDFIQQQRIKYQKGQLSTNRQKQLEEIGCKFKTELEEYRSTPQQAKKYSKFVEGVIKRLDFPAGAPAEVEKKLSDFIQQQRIKYQKGQLSATRQKQLEEIGVLVKKKTEEEEQSSSQQDNTKKARSVVMAKATKASQRRPKRKRSAQQQPPQRPRPKKKRQQRQPNQKYSIGKTFSKEFPPHGIFAGTVSEYNTKTGLYFVTYEDGDTEEMDEYDMDRTLKRMQAVPYKQQKHKLGTTFVKVVNGHLLEGTITSYNQTGLYNIYLEKKDGDDHVEEVEFLDEHDIDRQLAITTSPGSVSSVLNKGGPPPKRGGRVSDTSSSSSSSCNGREDNLKKTTSIDMEGGGITNAVMYPTTPELELEDGSNMNGENPPPQKKIMDQKHPLGTTFQKQSDGQVAVDGTVVHYSPQTGLYKVKFQDGDVEEEEMDEIDIDIALLLCSKRGQQQQQQQQQVVVDPTPYNHPTQKHPLGITFQKEFFGYKGPFEGTLDDEEALDECGIDRQLFGNNSGNDNRGSPLPSATQERCTNNGNDTEPEASSSSSSSSSGGGDEDESYGEDAERSGEGYTDDNGSTNKKKCTIHGPPAAQKNYSVFHENCFMKQYNNLLEFKRIHGHCRVPQSKKFKTLGGWVNNLRVMYNRDPENGVRPDRWKMLEQVGFVWNAGSDRLGNDVRWDEQYKNLVEFRSKFSHCRVPQTGSYRKLGRWVATQRALYVKDPINGIRPDRLRLLNDIEFTWDAKGFKGKHFYSTTTADEVGEIFASTLISPDSGSLAAAADETGADPV